MPTSPSNKPEISPASLRRVARGRASFWTSSFIVGALLTAAGAALAGGWLILQVALAGWQQLALQLSVILLPAVLWLVLFALLVRKDVTARRTTFLLWLVTAALYLVTVRPLLADAFQMERWLSATWWSAFAGDLLVAAPLEIFLIYLIVRLGVYPTSAFSRRTDGPLYGVAAGLGVATIVLLLRWFAVATPDFGRLVIEASEVFLGYATLGAWMGYFLGQMRFKRMTGFYLVAGFLLTIFFHALYFFTLSAFSIQTYIDTALIPLSRVIFAAIFAFFSFLFIFWRIRSANKDFQRMATFIDEREKKIAANAKSLLGDVVRMVETNQLEVMAHPPGITSSEVDRDNSDNEIDHLKRNWDALLSEQEAGK